MSGKKYVQKYNSAADEAARLGVKKSWIWEKARAKEIPCTKIGKYYFFDPQEVDDWIKSRSVYKKNIP